MRAAIHKTIFLTAGAAALAVMPATCLKAEPLPDPDRGYVSSFDITTPHYEQFNEMLPYGSGEMYLLGWTSLARVSSGGVLLWHRPLLKVNELNHAAVVDNSGTVYSAYCDYASEVPIGVARYSAAGEYLGDLQLPAVTAPLVAGLAFDGARNLLYVIVDYWDEAAEAAKTAIAMYGEDLTLLKTEQLDVCGYFNTQCDYAESSWGSGLDSNGALYFSGYYEKNGQPNYYAAKYEAGLNSRVWVSKGDGALNAFPGFKTSSAGGMAFLRSDPTGSATYLGRVTTSGVFTGGAPVPLTSDLRFAVDGAGNAYVSGRPESYGRPEALKVRRDGSFAWDDRFYVGDEDVPEAMSLDARNNLYFLHNRGYGEAGADVLTHYVMERYLQTAEQDAAAPAAVKDLSLSGLAAGSVTLSWTAPGDDGNIGTASSYDLRYTTAGPLTTDADFTGAVRIPGIPAPQSAGAAETFTVTGLMPGSAYYFGIKTADEAWNVSGLSNSPMAVTLPVGRYSVSKSTGDNQIMAVGGVTEPMVSMVKDGNGNVAEHIGLTFSISAFPAGAAGQTLAKSSETTVDGLADVQLKLGNIPAEYVVTATCETCEPFASSVTFTCCGKLPNDHLSQSGVPDWSPTCYANNNCQVIPDATIAWRGCGLTSLATLINYYSDNVHSGISRTNPGTLNTYLRGLPGSHGYDIENDVNFHAIERYTSGRAYFLDRYDVGNHHSEEALLDMSDGLIRSGIPLIFRVKGHFLLVIGKCGNNYVVADPAGGRERLYSPDDINEREFEGLRIFGTQ